jgi:hypothetical protein
MDKIVDVFLDDELLISYPISLQDMSGSPTDADFIALAKENLSEDGYSDDTLPRLRPRDDAFGTDQVMPSTLRREE